MNRSMLKFLFSAPTLRLIKDEIRPDHIDPTVFFVLADQWLDYVTQDPVALSLGHGLAELQPLDVAVVVAALNGNVRYNYHTILIDWLVQHWTVPLLASSDREHVWVELGQYVSANQLDAYFCDSSGLFRAQEIGRDLDVLIGCLPAIFTVLDN